MIYPDVTDVFKDYCSWDLVSRRKYLRYAVRLMNEHGKIAFKDVEYHNIEDLTVDLDADCYLPYEDDDTKKLSINT
ncbi:MAG TPA: hypothetical protein PKJ48_20385 [Cyclobacteriaceae bacterium]|nr:hypothetical protein [Cyclobacteriaceae bacterium]HMV09242.1 hypothetical protein [Cyclobacteriaceae bacterium]HMX01389.1 hypothetical protein [Cyclobacteriaceae bacterium]HMX50341.1 hypothetical protein [Cyclobacteriaceae bacterium]HMY92409.1 hypothetical protein [Cyclobacteriaceae bacterium]